ncbi:bifunctional RNA-binding domain superfamily/RNA recognition motif domain/Cwf19-like protein/HIT-like superfamily/Nucleotide-binding alpha-beta plait domain superfamily/Cwf19-like [Babesia duncani]|uniref:Bifunctional RNA-binding domain superfamily/RNA recognition motif domain/Cwf19-like protein/HIT-like superfamily/Nucleotide-binding alpha-beta plait domain superfamily/Cwf19-like n=1 Tax=Babesia duncani TaxID=323732 RepID=A0AAD9UPI3_9APIC|nr:bifunctional RNA-binding domain superfamily/RNA recognition motif domain/Cwf19-like protein/HIT-like superfamily/Nucleotide-binding alpha-beta plait domain superfamily/Cwf19-like [Babesia duncani]KAK2196825.1 bifunctional RNA-binding domain superfamily/RNA recognition motif domain/Cwf19-like protein/HIT-like superfamily/Nucleotide-binding alpha-beta plait domain superfamily/Cwf19-like [Babesia duncani]
MESSKANTLQSMPMANCTVIVTNVPRQVNEQSLKKAMSYFGTVVSIRVRIPSDPSTAATAWVLYESESEATAACKASGKLECGGCALVMNPYEAPQDFWTSDKHADEHIESDASVDNDKCWFCLGNSRCQTHMISLVLNHCYVAIAKGQLHDLHAMVIPIEHYSSLAAAPYQVQTEIQEAIFSIFEVILEQGMGAIAFERHLVLSNPIAMHTEVQIIPVPLETAMSSFSYADSADCFSRAQRVTLENETLSDALRKARGAYFYLMAIAKPKADGELQYSHALWNLTGSNSKARNWVNFPVNFGREMAISLISKTGRKILAESVDWRRCTQSIEKETEVARKLALKLAPPQE